MGQKEDRDNTLERVTNVAIILVSAVFLLSHSADMVDWVKQQAGKATDRRLVAHTWEELIDTESLLDDGEKASGRPILVEFIDYQCPACRVVGPAVFEASARGTVVVAIRHLPLEGLHPMARTAAKAAVCAERQGRFQPAHELLLSDDEWVNSDDWVRFAEVIGIDDAGEYASCLEGGEAEARIDRDKNLAIALSIASTPAFVTADGIHYGVGGFRAALEESGGLTRNQP